MGTAVILILAAVMAVAIVLVARRSLREKQPPVDETPTTQFTASGSNFSTTPPRVPSQRNIVTAADVAPGGAFNPQVAERSGGYPGSGSRARMAPPRRTGSASARQTRSSYGYDGGGAYDGGASFGGSYDGGGSSFGGGGDCGGSSSGGGDGGGGGGAC